MRWLGIDYGAKRVGLALSDPGGKFASPWSVIPNTPRLIEIIAQLCRQQGVERIVIGESKNLAGQANPTLRQSQKFASRLSLATELAISWEPEQFTSAAALRVEGKTADLDARAAALILQSYLDRMPPVKT